MTGSNHRPSAVSALTELHHTVTLQCLDSMPREDVCLKLQQKKGWFSSADIFIFFVTYYVFKNLISLVLIRPAVSGDNRSILLFNVSLV